jgi:hypothetical protein
MLAPWSHYSVESTETLSAGRAFSKKGLTHLKTTTMEDSVFVIRPRPLYIIRPDARTEVKLRT